MKFNNINYSKKEVFQRTGSIQQLAGSQKYTLEGGKGKGTSMIRVRNGSGLDFNIIADRALDIFDVSFHGKQLAWISANGIVSNQNYEETGAGWLRSFGGGLLVTCGLRNVGPPIEDDGESFGLHGRISNIPARNVSIDEYWKEEIFYQKISGEIRESNVFGENLVIYRTIQVNSDDAKICIKDKIVNEGFTSQQLMLLYHINWGFPLFSEKTEIEMDVLKTRLRGKDSSKDLKWNSFSPPVRGFEEEVYFHDLNPDEENKISYQLKNPDAGLGVKVLWDKSALPYLTEWKMTGESEYVLGMEPGNTLPLGRKAIRDEGKAEFLEPFGEKEVEIEVEFNANEK